MPTPQELYNIWVRGGQDAHPTRFFMYNIGFTPLLAPPSVPPQRGEEKDKPLIWEGLGVGFIRDYLSPADVLTAKYQYHLKLVGVFPREINVLYWGNNTIDYF
jgi:hypothetical protein